MLHLVITYRNRSEGSPWSAVRGSSTGARAAARWCHELVHDHTPATGTNWVLQERTNLTLGAWTNSPSGWTNPITVPATQRAKFYRLFNP
jgi:hypothetical protein